MVTETTETDNLQMPNEYVKRSFTRKVKTTKNVEVVWCEHAELHKSKDKQRQLIERIVREGKSGRGE